MHIPDDCPGARGYIETYSVKKYHMKQPFISRNMFLSREKNNKIKNFSLAAEYEKKPINVQDAVIHLSRVSGISKLKNWFSF